MRLFLLSVRLSSCFESKTTGRILLQFDMDIMTLELTPNSYFLCPIIINTNMTDAQACEAEATIAPLNVGT